MSDAIKNPKEHPLEQAKIEVLEHIMEEWSRVKKDRSYATECLARTGPGESPYTKYQEHLWELREQFLAKALLSSMSDIAPLIQSVIDSNKR